MKSIVLVVTMRPAEPLQIAWPLPIGKIVDGAPTMERSLAFGAIEPAVSSDRTFYLDGAVKRAAKHATEIDAHG